MARADLVVDVVEESGDRQQLEQVCRRVPCREGRRPRRLDGGRALQQQRDGQDEQEATTERRRRGSSGRASAAQGLYNVLRDWAGLARDAP
eukprot:scaffold8023_cov103-Isochrysis_galbana.AAC.23